MTASHADTAIRVGISLVPLVERIGRTRELARVADEAGVDLVGIQDHPYQHHFFDTWSLIPTLLAEAKRISFFTDVANLPLVHRRCWPRLPHRSTC
jgi:alkanesulfonate monooxygenase SsuD/methylene tetrahydromethanopterin reductase-like flavin-dependent oxidoreductase (luciferase family)